MDVVFYIIVLVLDLIDKELGLQNFQIQNQKFNLIIQLIISEIHFGEQ